MNTLQKNSTKYRTHTCGELTLKDAGKQVTLSGWVQKARNLGSMSFVDLRDRYGITQITFNNDHNSDLCQKAQELGREFVIQIEGKVIERQSKNQNIATGEIEVLADSLRILNKSEVPPFTIEANSDGGDELRMKYRYLDLRRSPLQENLMLRSMMAYKSREYLIKQGFVEVETPFLIGSTPEGARDFIVPSRMNEGQFYALPQSPQLFKQLLMVAGYDRYFQVVKCFRDEDLRADRQPEFTQLDCEMSFVGQEDVLNTFEGLFKHVLKDIRGIDITYDFPRMPWSEAMEKYGSDKPDLRFGMEFKDITKLVKGKDFKVFDEAEYVGAICAPNCSEYTRKQLDELTEFVKKPQVGAKGLVYIRYNADGTIKSSIDKFYTQDEMLSWCKQIDAKAGDLILVLCGPKMKTLGHLGTLRLEMGNQLGFMDKNIFKPLWVIDFPLVEWGEEEQRFFAMHHPFTSPKDEDMHLLDTDPGKVRANAYDLVVNGVELGGGSVRIFDKEIQNKMLGIIGFTQEEADKQFGFLMNAFKFGAPPHAGIAFGFDRWVSLIAGLDSIRDTIAFPKNNSGRDVMTGAPYEINPRQLDELKIKIVK